MEDGKVTPEELLQWGRNFIVAEMAPGGAWRLSVSGLQWGCNFIVAEIIQGWTEREAEYRASMGPQLYRCGNQDRAAGTLAGPGGFNGAATLSLRK